MWGQERERDQNNFSRPRTRTTLWERERDQWNRVVKLCYLNVWHSIAVCTSWFFYKLCKLSTIMNKYESNKALRLSLESQHTTWTVRVNTANKNGTMSVSYKVVRRWGHEAKMHENENNVMRTRTRTRTTKGGRERERDLKIWPRDQVGLENLTSLVNSTKQYMWNGTRRSRISTE